MGRVHWALCSEISLLNPNCALRFTPDCITPCPDVGPLCPMDKVRARDTIERVS